MFGALNLRTQKFYWKQAITGNSKTFKEFLHQLHKAHPSKRLLIILDNGPIHKSLSIKRFVEKNNWVTLYFLPTYSPEYNPIERFWKWLKKSVYGAKAYSSIARLISKIRKIAWHYNENWLITSIKFEFKKYEDLL